MLPGAAKVRALVVGLEDYPDLGHDFRVPGGAAAAAAFARWLVQVRGVDAGSVELWLAPANGVDPEQVCREAGLEAVACRRFDWAAFQAAVDAPRGIFADGGTFLIVYFCGHGAATGAHNTQHLVLPHASKAQFRCIDLENWRSFFASGMWAHFSHQLWIVDACRNHWGFGLDPSAQTWHVGDIVPVSRALLSSCAEGEVASASFDTGPRYTRELLRLLEDDKAAPWPDFDRAFDTIAHLLRNTGTARQSPSIRLESWAGKLTVDPGNSGQRLEELLEQIDWEFRQFLPYVMRAQSLAQPGFAPPATLREALQLLSRLAPVDGIEPIVDFAARVADARNDPALRHWAELSLSPRQKAELQARRHRDRAFVRLSLWFRSDAAQYCIDAGLDVVDAGSGVRPWTRKPPKPVAPGNELAIMGEWVQEVYDHVNQHDFDLEIELFLAADMLARATFDIAEVRLPGPGGDVLRFGEDFATVLRCADRYKGGRKLHALRSVAPAILARHGRSTDPLRWAAQGDDPAALIDAFRTNGPAAPVWLGCNPVPGEPAALLHAALGSGLPAAIWLRAHPSLLTEEDLCAKLKTLLTRALGTLPAALKDWRRDEPDAAARTIALLLDDPDSIPALFTQMRQPGE